MLKKLAEEKKSEDMRQPDALSVGSRDFQKHVNANNAGFRHVKEKILRQLLMICVRFQVKFPHE